MADETETRTEGPTPAGGDYSIARWQDADGNPTTEDQAVMVEVHEFDGAGAVINTTYASLNDGE